MAIRYVMAPDVAYVAREVVGLLGWSHIHLEHLSFVRSFGSKSRRTIARCHTLGKAMQVGMGRKKGFYLIEVISERYDRLPEDEKIKTIIHELMHIPKSFGGGFVHHDRVHDESVSTVYEVYINLKRDDMGLEWYS